MASDSIPNPTRRLIICCDGTSQDAFKVVESRSKLRTNISTLARAIKTKTDGGIEQIVFYQAGVGTIRTEQFGGGVFGWGLLRHVREAYGFLAHNYRPGDEIFFFGFSRGGYTARSICELVCRLGILTELGMDEFPTIIGDFYKKKKRENKDPKEYEEWKKEVEKGRDQFIEDKYLHKEKVNVVAIGCFDTVGFEEVVGNHVWGEDYTFHNMALPRGIKHAFHALSLDEKRGPFKPTLWFLYDLEGEAAQPNLNQVWFAGDHSDIGGGYLRHDLADITLLWMVDQCAEAKILEFDEDYIKKVCVCDKPNPFKVPSVGENSGNKRWAYGYRHDSYEFASLRYIRNLWRWAPIVGRTPRTPMEYKALSKVRPGFWPETAEFIHETVVLRSEEEEMRYKSSGLKGWGKPVEKNKVTENGENAGRKVVSKEVRRLKEGADGVAKQEKVVLEMRMMELGKLEKELRKWKDYPDIQNIPAEEHGVAVCV